MTVSVSAIIDRAGIYLQDTDHVTWTEAKIISAVRDALQTIKSLNPVIIAETETISMVAGSLQSAGGLFITAIRNAMGRAITNYKLSDFQAFEAEFPSDTGDTVAVSAAPALDRTKFYVWPKQSSAGSQVEIARVADFPAITSETQFSYPDDIEAAILEFVIYRAFDAHAETQEAGRAMRHFENFLGMIGVKGGGK